jgi:hypothetical protein
LIPGSHPTICAECQRRQQGKTTHDKHHPFGKANSPITASVPVNDHRAELSEAQHDWPKRTRENPDGSPALKGAGIIRGFVDMMIYLVKKGVLWVAEMLERLDVALVERVGRTWWTTLGLA